jgi:ParB-like chromosome segregation protein Spo0J
MMPSAEQIERRPLADLIPYARNARTHSDAQVAQIAGSIREFGFTNPVLIDTEGGIIAGHGRVLAARQLGMEAVPCIVLSHLNDVQRRAYIIADNRLAENAGWDDAMLGLELSALNLDDYDLGLLGFDADELSALLNGPPNFEPGSEDDQGKLDELAPKIVTCPHCGEEFDIREQS